MSDERLTPEELERLIGEWVLCGRCFDRENRAVTLAFLTIEDDGRPALTPTEFVTFEKEPVQRYMPVLGARPEKFAAVELACAHCRYRRRWRATTVRNLPAGRNGTRAVR